MAVFKKQGVYWIDYYMQGHRKRERIGPDKRLAELTLKKRKVEIAEGKWLDRRKPITTTFDELAEVYLRWIAPDPMRGLPARKRSWNTLDVYAIKKLVEYFGTQRLTAITPALVEQYRAWRRATIAHHGRRVKPAAVNKELAIFGHLVTVAQKGLIILPGGVPQDNPVASVSMEAEHNVRDRVLVPEEFACLLEAAADWLKPILQLAYHTGMRKGEIRLLRWEQVDVKRHVIRLASSDTKTGEDRRIPLNERLRALLAARPRGVGTAYVFPNPQTCAAYTGRAIAAAFARACQRTGITGAVFHDLRHSFVTHARRAGIDYFRIMAITGHKTMAVFKRYHLIEDFGLHEAVERLDTYMDAGTAQMVARE
jgi:integrase